MGNLENLLALWRRSVKIIFVMVDRLTTPSTVAPAHSDVDAFESTHVSGIWDGIKKLFGGEISFSEFREVVKTRGATFARTFETNAKVKTELVPLLNGLKNENNPAVIYDKLRTTDSNGVSIAMIASTTKDGASVVAELCRKLTVDQAKDLLTHKSNSSATLYSYVAAKARGHGDGDAPSIVAKLYEQFGISTDPSEVVAVIAQQEAHVEAPGGYGCGSLTAKMQAENSTIALAQMFEKIGFKNGKALTPEQVANFDEWIEENRGNLDTFIRAFAGNTFEQGQIALFCDALYNSDGGAAMKELLQKVRCEAGNYGLPEGSDLTIGGYAIVAGLPDIACRSLLTLYRKCGLHGEIRKIGHLPRTGWPIFMHSRKVLAESKFVIVDNTRGTYGCPLTIHGEAGKRISLENIRQVGQFESIEQITIRSDTTDVTADDLTHLLEGAVKLKTFILRGTAEGGNITMAMIQEALTRSGMGVGIRVKYEP
jgi:hypothetical protein